MCIHCKSLWIKASAKCRGKRSGGREDQIEREKKRKRTREGKNVLIPKHVAQRDVPTCSIKRKLYINIKSTKM